jgi:hypothetical protein
LNSSRRTIRPAAGSGAQSSKAVNSGGDSSELGRYDSEVSVIRVEIPEEVAKRLATEAAGQGKSTEDLAAEVLSRHVPQPPPAYRVPRFVGQGHSGRHDLSERVEEILSSELGA